MSEKPEANKEVLENIRDVLAGKEGEAAPDDSDNDVMELTQKVNDDGSITDLKTAETQADEKSENDVLSQIDNEVGAKEVTPEPKKEDEKDVELELAEESEKPEPEEKPEEKVMTEEQNAEDVMADFDAVSTDAPAAEKPAEKPEAAVISDTAAEAAKSSLQGLVDKVTPEYQPPKTEPSAPFRSGETVEDLVTEMLKPMMKDWLDNNLPKLVEDVVQREIAKIMPK